MKVRRFFLSLIILGAFATFVAWLYDDQMFPVYMQRSTRFGSASSEHIGFFNGNNVCYSNSVLQVLTHLPGITEWKAQSFNSDTHRASSALAQLIDDVGTASAKVQRQEAQKTSISATRPSRALGGVWVTGTQEDALEYLDQLRKAIEGETQSVFPASSNFTVRNPNPSTRSSFNINMTSTETVLLQERMDGMDDDIEVDLPYSLIRPRQALPSLAFMYIARQGETYPAVNSAELRAPIEGLSIRSVSGEQAQYNLIAVIERAGRRITSGHYYAIVKSEGKWIRFNDTVVDEMQDFDSHPLKSFKTAVLLVYHRTNP